MNFAKLKKPLFGTRASSDDVPANLTARARIRRTGMLAEAAHVLDLLPRPGEAVHGIMSGRYDLMHLLLAIIGKQPGPCERLRIATLSFNTTNVYEMVGLFDREAVTTLDVLCSTFFKDHQPETYNHCHREFTSRGQRLAHARNHCKVVTMTFADGTRFALEGSANLRTNSNWEQFCLVNCRELHDWHAAWIDEKVATHGQGDETTSTATP